MTSRLETIGNGEERDALKREVYFPTYIYYKDLSGHEDLNATLKASIYEERNRDREGIVRSNVKATGTWHSGLGLADHPKFEPLTKQVTSMASEIFNSLGYHSDWQPRIDNMWANIAPHMGFNRAHTHPKSLWSGVYYVQASEASGQIFFTEPRNQALVLSPVYDRPLEERPETWSEVYFMPIEGRMLLFPAWLVHQTEPNMNKAYGPAGDRISISFNISQIRAVPRE